MGWVGKVSENKFQLVPRPVFEEAEKYAKVCFF